MRSAASTWAAIKSWSGRQHGGTGAHLVGQGRQAELHALAAIALALPVQRADVGHTSRTGSWPAGSDPPNPAGSHGTVRGLCKIFSQSRQVNFSRTVWTTFQLRGITSSVSVMSSPSLESRSRAATATDLGRRNHHALARQMLRERLARWPPASERLDCRGLRGCLFGGELVLARARLQLLELQLQLVEQARLALRALAVDLAPAASRPSVSGRR